MNAVVTSSSGALVPANFDQAMRFAEMMAKSKMVPKHFQGKPEECLVIIEQSMRWEMSPYAVIQCASMIHERPMYEGKLVAAVVNARGPRYGLQGRLHYAYAGVGDDRTITVSGVLDGKPEAITVKLKDAKTANEHWKKQPDQQLAYHGARVWARRWMPELMLGVYSPEEMDVAPPVVLADTFAGPTLEAHAEPTPTPTPAPSPKPATALTEWISSKLPALLGECATVADVEALAEGKVYKAAVAKGTQAQRDEMTALFIEAMDRVEAVAKEATEAAAEDDGWPGPDVPARGAA
jgi:biotin carboxyl carrier protein